MVLFCTPFLYPAQFWVRSELYCEIVICFGFWAFLLWYELIS